MTAPVQKPRLPFVDFMKGLCIMLIVMNHIDGQFFDALAPGLNNALQAFRVPMYYFLSGLFFKTYGGFSEFSRKKTNNIIVPLVFFQVMAFVFMGVSYAYKSSRGLPSVVGFEWIYLFDPILVREWHVTYALWFLLSLFEVNLIYYALQTYLRPWWSVAAVVLLSIVGFVLCAYNIELPLHFDTALVGLPFFVLGASVRRGGLLQAHPADKWGPLVFLPVAVVVYVFAGHIDIHNQVLPTYWQLYVIPFMAILGLCWACKRLPYVPLVCYWGRYSLIVLGTHGLFYAQSRSVGKALMGDSLWASVVTFAVVMGAELVIIPLLVRYAPRFTAQKEFFATGWRPFWRAETK